MKLTLRPDQIDLARATVAWLREDAAACPTNRHTLPGYESSWCNGPVGSGWADALAAAIAEHDQSNTIPVRIRVGVTASGQYFAVGCSDGPVPDLDRVIAANGRSIIAYHWVTAHIPRPQVEHGETAGEVES